MENDLKQPTIFSGRATSNVQKTPNEISNVLLLKALSEGVNDPEELAKIAGLHSAAQAVVALDRLSLRKEWHAALMQAGLDIQHIAIKLKELIDSKNERTSLGAVKTALTSIGLNEFKGDVGQAKSWESEMIEAARKRRETAIDADFRPAGQYEIVEPEVPKSVREKQEMEKKEAESLYGEKKEEK